MRFNFSPILEVVDLLPMTYKRLMALPDIIDIRCGRYALAFYLYPIASWHWQTHIEKTSISLNSLIAFGVTYYYEVILPTMHVEFVKL